MIKILNNFDILDNINLKVNDNNILVDEDGDFIDDNTETTDILDNNNISYATGSLCYDCGDFIEYGDERYYTDSYNDEQIICNDCYYNSGNYFYCNDCDRTYNTNEMDCYTIANGDTICKHCYDDYITCSNCGELFYHEDTYYCEECEEDYCEGCWEEHEHEGEYIYGYHCFNDWQPKKLESEAIPEFYIGHELEIDGGQNKKEVAKMITEELPCICMNDGSLSYNGIEIISHPLSYSYMLSKEKQYRKIFNRLISEYNYKSHDTNTCGLHFHVSRPDEETINRIILFMETYKDELIKFSRRTDGQIEHWANFLSTAYYNKDKDEKEIKSIDFIKKDKNNHDRYMALNLKNTNTIEYRLFRGSLKYETFMACYELVYFLTTMANNKKIPLNKLSWNNVTNNGKYLKEYVKERNITTDKIIKDYSKEVIIERNRKISNIKKDMNKLYKRVITEINNITLIDKRKTIDTNKLIDTNRLTLLSNALSYIVGDIKQINENKDNIDIKSFESNVIYYFDKLYGGDR